MGIHPYSDRESLLAKAAENLKSEPFPLNQPHQHTTHAAALAKFQCVNITASSELDIGAMPSCTLNSLQIVVLKLMAGNRTFQGCTGKAKKMAVNLHHTCLLKATYTVINNIPFCQSVRPRVYMHAISEIKVYLFRQFCPSDFCGAELEL